MLAGNPAGNIHVQSPRSSDLHQPNERRDVNRSWNHKSLHQACGSKAAQSCLMANDYSVASTAAGVGTAPAYRGPVVNALQHLNTAC